MKGIGQFTREADNNIILGNVNGRKVLAKADSADVKLYYNDVNEDNLVATLVAVDITKLEASNFIL